MPTKEWKKTGEEAQAAVRQAERASRRGDLAQAERWTKAAEKQSEIAQRLADAGMIEDPEEDERIRAELRERIARFCELGMEEKAWMEARETWCDEVVRCYNAGLPMPAPMPPCPVTEAQMVHVMQADIERVREEDAKRKAERGLWR